MKMFFNPSQACLVAEQFSNGKYHPCRLHLALMLYMSRQCFLDRVTRIETRIAPGNSVDMTDEVFRFFKAHVMALRVALKVQHKQGVFTPDR
jgi:hypothetical protein